MTAYIFCGGEFFADSFCALQPYDLAIAADSGMYAALQLGIVPDLFIGDFDSFDLSRITDNQKKLVENIKTVTYPAKKDLTDSMIAIEAAVDKGADAIVRGVRNTTDFDVEYQLALINRGIYPGLETMLMPASTEYQHFSSSMAREMIRYHQPLEKYLPKEIIPLVLEITEREKG